jgi:hypothetical protein
MIDCIREVLHIFPVVKYMYIQRDRDKCTEQLLRTTEDIL